MNYALYNKEQLAYERSIGLELSDSENENFYKPMSGTTLYWSNVQFEQYLATKEWLEEIKNKHRASFTGTITFDDGCISY